MVNYTIGSGATPPGMNSFNASNIGGIFSVYQSALSQATNANGQVDYPRLQRMLGLTNDQMNAVIGQGEAWLSPDELRAKTNALESGLWSGGSSSGGGGAAGSGGMNGGATGTSSGGSLLGGSGLLGGSAASGNGTIPTGSPSGISGFPNIPNTQPSNNYYPGTGGGSTQVGGGIPSNMGQNGAVPMMQSSAGNALSQYQNTAGYQLTNGQNAVNNFQTSPGYQFAVDQALGQVQRQGASRGLLDSGAGLKAMTDRAQNMANQEFNNWQTNQQNQYNQYQNRLAGLAGGPTGAEQAYGLGQGVGNNAMQTGSNIGSILANQGNSLFGGIVGAGGAQAQNVTQAGNMQAQILGNNLQTQMMLAALAAGGQR